MDICRKNTRYCGKILGEWTKGMRYRKYYSHVHVVGIKMKTLVRNINNIAQLITHWASASNTHYTIRYPQTP